MRGALAVAAVLLTVIGLILWTTSEGHLDCPEGQSLEIVSYMTTTSKVGKTNTRPVYACK